MTTLEFMQNFDRCLSKAGTKYDVDEDNGNYTYHLKYDTMIGSYETDVVVDITASKLAITIDRWFDMLKCNISDITKITFGSFTSGGTTIWLGDTAVNVLYSY